MLEHGTVVEFDDHKGFGLVEGADGRRLFFHCTAVADGSRTIAVGADVVFAVVAGHRGGWEATSLVRAAPLGSGAPQDDDVAGPGPGPGPGPGGAAVPP